MRRSRSPRSTRVPIALLAAGGLVLAGLAATPEAGATVDGRAGRAGTAGSGTHSPRTPAPASAAASTSASASPKRRAATRSYGSVQDILPPGDDGNVDAAQLVSLGLHNGTGVNSVPSLLGGLTAPQALLTTATPTQPAHYADQLEQYDALNRADPSKLTDASLSRYYKPETIAVPPGQVDHVEHPRPGTTIVWDKHGVPHVQGATDEDLAYGAGVADAETRLFLTDVLRHTGAAEMAQFVGPTPGDIAQDAAQLRNAPYRPAELNAQIAALVHRSPQAARLVHSIDAYVAGLNAEQSTLCPATTATVPMPGGLGAGFGVNCPVEYAALQKPPAPYTPADIVSIASLIGGIFGTGGGGQYTNAIWLQQLQAKYGRAAGKKIYNDLREKDDPEAPVTSPVPSHYGGPPRVRPGLPGVAMPDLHPRATALATGAIVGNDGSLSAPPAGAAGNQGNASTTDPRPTPHHPGGKGLGHHPGRQVSRQGSRQASRPASRQGTGQVSRHGSRHGAHLAPSISASGLMTRAGVQRESASIEGSLQRAESGELVGMSNALIVDAKHSRGGHPTAVFGPQTGYYAPQLLMEESLSGPNTQAAGVSFAGTNFVVEIGRGLDYAWSATSPYTDITDTVVQHLCNTDGTKPTVHSTAYVDEAGRCRPMIDYEHTETALPSLAGAAAPQTVSFLVLRTDQGIVRLRTTVKGRPVAVSIDRSTYGHEPDSVLGFVDMDDPHKVHGPRSYFKAADKIAFTFNWYYVDDKHIAYFSSARLPRRAPGTDLDLPRWGSKRYDWRGFLPLRRHPHVVDPTTGFIDNWNNKLAPGFASSSQVYADGPVYRSLTLQDRIEQMLRHGKATRHGLVGAMISAATVDVRGAYDLPYVLKVIGHPRNPRLRSAVGLLHAWVRAGAHRVDRARSGHYGHQAAIDLFDTWWDPQDAGATCLGHAGHCVFSLPEDAMRGGLGGYVKILPEPLDDNPREHIGSAFNGISWYGYLNKDLRSVLHLPVEGAYSRLYCGPLKQCRNRLRHSLLRAADAALRTEKVGALGRLTYDKTRDDIEAVAGGVVGVRPIDWQNRPTYQQVVRFTSHR